MRLANQARYDLFIRSNVDHAYPGVHAELGRLNCEAWGDLPLSKGAGFVSDLVTHVRKCHFTGTFKEVFKVNRRVVRSPSTRVQTSTALLRKATSRHMQCEIEKLNSDMPVSGRC